MRIILPGPCLPGRAPPNSSGRHRSVGVGRPRALEPSLSPLHASSCPIHPPRALTMDAYLNQRQKLISTERALRFDADKLAHLTDLERRVRPPTSSLRRELKGRANPACS